MVSFLLIVFIVVFFSVYKPKKGLATPKQRLGRIIKIHKMMK